MKASSTNQKNSFFSFKLVKIIAAFFISLYLIIWAVSSPVSKHFIEPVLLEQGLSISSDTSIYYNPFLSQLTVSDLTLFKQNAEKEEKVFTVNELTIQLTLFRLLFDKIVISEFELNGAYVKVNKTPTQLIVAGIDLNKESDEAPANEEIEIKTEPQPFLYQVILPNLALNNVKIDINNEDKPHQINIKELIISKVQADLTAQQALLSLDSTIDETSLELTADANLLNGQGDINSQLTITNYPINRLKRYVEELTELSGSLSLNTKQKLTLGDDTVNLHITKADLKNSDLVVGIQQQFINLETFENTINDLKLTLSNGEITALSGISQLSLINADVYQDEPSNKLAAFKQLSLNDISFHFIDAPQIKIASLILDDTYGSKFEETDLPPVVSLKQFNISDILITEKQLVIDKIFLDSFQSNVVIDKEGALANLVTPPGAETDEDAVITEVEEEISEVSDEIAKESQVKKPEFTISLNEFSLTNDTQISLLDHSVEPVKERNIFIDTLSLGAISNAEDKRDQPTPFELIGRSNKYAHFDFKGTTQPFSKEPKHYVKGFLKELSLPNVSRYMKKAMQMELKSGQLNTDVEVTLTGEELDGNVVILLRGLETAIADSEEAGALIDQGALPFNMALGMLKDGNGDVELEVPLSGSTSDPSFGMSSIVGLITQKAIWMATQDYLMTTFVPYANVVSVAMTVGEFALKLRFDDLPYQIKQIEPNEAQLEYLNGFIALMQDKEDTRVNICAVSTPEDIGLTNGEKITDKKHISQLKEIGEQREAAFKDYIIKQGNIASSRLLLCTPKIDSDEEAKPRIELSV